MDLRVADVQSMLNVSRKTLYRWIQARKIPAYRISGRYRFDREEIERWVGSARVAADSAGPDCDTAHATPIGELLLRGGIHYRVEGSSMPEAIERALAVTALPGGIEPGALLRAVLERERLMSTAVGFGIAVPHPREPMLSRPEEERVALCFLESPVDFRAPDGVPVSALFIVLGWSLRGQLRLLSLIARLCHEDAFVRLIGRQASRTEIADHVGAWRGPEAG